MSSQNFPRQELGWMVERQFPSPSRTLVNQRLMGHFIHAWKNLNHFIHAIDTHRKSRYLIKALLNFDRTNQVRALYFQGQKTR